MRKYFLLIAGVSVAITGGLTWVHGYRTGYDSAAIYYARQQELQEAINREAMRAADRKYTTLIDEIEDAKQALADQLILLELEADADPDANVCGINAAASVRINSVR